VRNDVLRVALGEADQRSAHSPREARPDPAFVAVLRPPAGRRFWREERGSPPTRPVKGSRPRLAAVQAAVDAWLAGCDDAGPTGGGRAAAAGPGGADTVLEPAAYYDTRSCQVMPRAGRRLRMPAETLRPAAASDQPSSRWPSAKKCGAAVVIVIHLGRGRLSCWGSMLRSTGRMAWTARRLSLEASSSPSPTPAANDEVGQLAMGAAPIWRRAEGLSGGGPSREREIMTTSEAPSAYALSTCGRAAADGQPDPLLRPCFGRPAAGLWSAGVPG